MRSQGALTTPAGTSGRRRPQSPQHSKFTVPSPGEARAHDNGGEGTPSSRDAPRQGRHLCPTVPSRPASWAAQVSFLTGAAGKGFNALDRKGWAGGASCPRAKTDEEGQTHPWDRRTDTERAQHRTPQRRSTLPVGDKRLESRSVNLR